MVISANIATKLGKKEKKNRHLDTIMDNVGVLFIVVCAHFQIWQLMQTQLENQGEKAKKV